MAEPLPKTSEYNLERLGRALKKRRKKAKLTQHAMSKLIKADETNISHWETGRRVIPDVKLALFALQCGCRIEDLEDDMMNDPKVRDAK